MSFKDENDGSNFLGDSNPYQLEETEERLMRKHKKLMLF
jgi:hypothetical protein